MKVFQMNQDKMLAHVATIESHTAALRAEILMLPHEVGVEVTPEPEVPDDLEPPVEVLRRPSRWAIDPNFDPAYMGAEGVALYDDVKAQRLHTDPDLLKFGAIGNSASRTPGGVADTYALNFVETGDPYWLEGALEIVEPYIRYFLGETPHDPRRYRRFTYDVSSTGRVTTPGSTVAPVYLNATRQPWWRGDQGLDTIPAATRAGFGYRTLEESQGRRGFLKFIYWRDSPPIPEDAAKFMGVSYEHGLDLGQTLSWFARVIWLATNNQEHVRGPGKLLTADIARVGYDVILDTFEAFEYRNYRYFTDWGVYRFGSAVTHGFINVACFYADADKLWRYHNAGQPHPKISKGAASLESWLTESMFKVPAPNGGECVVYPHQNPRLQSVFGGSRYNPAVGPHLIRYTPELEADIIKLHDTEGSKIDTAMMQALANNQSQLWFGPVTTKNGRPYVARYPLCVDGAGRFTTGQLVPDTPLTLSQQVFASNTADSQARAYLQKRSGGLFVAWDVTPNQENVGRWEALAAGFPSELTDKRTQLNRLYRVIRRLR